MGRPALHLNVSINLKNEEKKWKIGTEQYLVEIYCPAILITTNK